MGSCVWLWLVCGLGFCDNFRPVFSGSVWDFVNTLDQYLVGRFGDCVNTLDQYLLGRFEDFVNTLQLY